LGRERSGGRKRDKKRMKNRREGMKWRERGTNERFLAEILATAVP